MSQASSSMCPTVRRRSVAALVLMLLIATDGRAADWPVWRGPTRDGRSTESSGWRNGDWLTEQPTWTAGLGEGCGAPIVVGNRLYALGWKGGKDQLHCLDATTGQSLWTQSYPCPRYARHHLGDEFAYSGPSAAPEFDPATGSLYTLSADGDLICWNTKAKGERVWSVNFYDKYDVPRRPEVGKKGSRRDYGYITAPLVHGDWLLVAVGAKDGHLMAFDKRSGERKWTSECVEPAGHCGGLAPIDVEGIPCLASLTIRKLVVIRLDKGHEGKTLAEFDWITDYGNNIASPMVDKNFVVITSAYNQSAMCKVEITKAGAKSVWRKPFMSGTCTPVLHEGHLYWASERMHCVDFETGELKWSGGAFGSPGSCIVTADRKIIAWGERGRLALIEPFAKSPTKYQELSRRTRLFDTYAWPHVVLANGHLYCKDRNGNLKCFKTTQ